MVENNNGTRSLLLTVRPSLGRNIARYYKFFLKQMRLKMLQRNGLFCLGSQTYSLMKNLLSPDKPGDKSFSEFVELLKNYYNPTPSEIVQ